jgi:phage gp46-like protein
MNFTLDNLITDAECELARQHRRLRRMRQLRRRQQLRNVARRAHRYSRPALLMLGTGALVTGMTLLALGDHLLALQLLKVAAAAWTAAAALPRA